MIKLIGVSKRFNKGRGIENIHLQVEKGEWVAIVGHAGAGKSTLLRCIYGLEKPDQGEIMVSKYRLHGLPKRKLPQVRRMLGVVDQDLALLPDRSVFHNVALVGEVLGWPSRKTKQASLHVLNRVGLYAHIDAQTTTLSYGERRRLAIARALVAQPFALIADEPFGHLDLGTARGIVELLSSIHEQGSTLLIATHRPELLEDLPVRIVKIKQGRQVE